MKQGFFVTGTDTGVGKTFVSCALLHVFARQGLRAVGMKPVAAGCRIEHGLLISEDVEQLIAAGNIAATPAAINPYAFEPPLAPHIAAHQAGIAVDFARVLDAFAALQAQADIVIVEGVGGFRVPLNDTQDTADLAATLGLPVIMVVGMRLGCLNHALLTSDAIIRAGLPLAGWIANQIDISMAAFEDNVAALDARLPAPRIATLPFLEKADWRHMKALDIGNLLEMQTRLSLPTS